VGGRGQRVAHVVQGVEDRDQVAPPAQARAAVDRIAAALSPALRPGFLERGRLVVALGRS
jgi:hypothetical protein